MRKEGSALGQVLLPDALQLAIETARAYGEQIVFTNGVFDLLHVGHVRYLQAARALGDRLVVAVNSDDSVRRLKGPLRPLVPQEERAELLAALACVDFVTLFDEESPAALITRLRPEVYCKGGDYAERPLPERATVESYGGRVVLLPQVDDRSSSRLIAEVVRRYGHSEQSDFGDPSGLRGPGRLSDPNAPSGGPRPA